MGAPALLFALELLLFARLINFLASKEADYKIFVGKFSENVKSIPTSALETQENKLVAQNFFFGPLNFLF